MKVLVSNPPWPGPGYGARSDVRWPHKRVDKYLEYPIYLAYTAAVLEEAGFEVHFLDGVMEEMSIVDFAEAVAEIAPRLLVLECSTPSIDSDLETAQAVKERVGDIYVALVGSHVTLFHWDILAENEAIDAVCRGEFELTVRELALALKGGGALSGVQGLSYQKNGQIWVNEPCPLIEDLDSLPFPARHIVKGEGYRGALYSGERPTAMVSSRGCPYRCIYCLWPETLYGHKFRARNAANVVEEMEQVVRDYGVDEIYFDDDCLTLDKGRVLEICCLIQERGIQVGWIAQSRVDTVDKEMLMAMKEAGCHYILFGVESGSPQILEVMRKRMSLERARETFKICRELGIRTQAFFLFGIPGETHETIRETIEFAKELDPYSAQFAIVIPHPGTQLHDLCVEKGWLVCDSWADFASLSGLIETEQLSQEDVERARVQAYREFYLRPRYILRTLLGIRRWQDIKRVLRSAKSIVDRISFFQAASD